MDEVVLLSSESTPPGSPSPVDFQPMTKVKDLCASSPPSTLEIVEKTEDNYLPSNYDLVNYYYEDLDESLESIQETDKKGASYHPMSDSDLELDKNQEEIALTTNSSESIDSEENPTQFKKRKIASTTKLRMSKEECKKLKELKDKEKAERKASSENLKRMKPRECLKYITVLIDRELSNTEVCSKALSIMEHSVHCCIVDQKLCNSITWIREVPSGDKVIKEAEKQMVLVWSSLKTLAAIRCYTLLEDISKIRELNPGVRLTLVILGLNKLLRKLASQRKKSENKDGCQNKRIAKEIEVTAEQMEMGLIELEVCHQVSNKSLETGEELAQFLLHFTKSVSEIPYRKELEKKDMEKSWYVRADSRKCVRVDKDMNGLSSLWIQQLAQFNKTTVDAAKCIVQLYPTPFCLYQAYNRCNSEQSKENLLKDIQIKRGRGPGATIRRLGPELSKKIYLLFGQSNAQALLSQE